MGGNGDSGLLGEASLAGVNLWRWGWSVGARVCREGSERGFKGKLSGSWLAGFGEDRDERVLFMAEEIPAPSSASTFTFFVNLHIQMRVDSFL